MALISLIAAMDENRGIGKNNQLMCHLPADLKFFKSITLGKPVIMGRRTYESIGRALPGRLNVVLSRQPIFIDGVTVVASLEEALLLTTDVAEVMIIGGERVFQEAMPLASRLYITSIHASFHADRFFPIIDPLIWHRCDAVDREKDETNKYDITFIRYEKIS